MFKRAVLIRWSTTFWLAAVASALGEDRVVVSAGAADSGRSRTIAGQVVDFTGETLRLRTGGGQLTSIDTARVTRVDTVWTAEQTMADRLLAEGKFREALANYALAVDRERRVWVRRKILAQSVWCDRALGRLDSAGARFLLVLRSDPTTQYFDSMPLVWWPHEPQPTAERQARQWLGGDAPPAAALMGASWLLSSSGRGAAIDALGRLKNDSDRRIAQLAEAQLWRTQIVTAGAGDVARWRQTVGRMPEPLRGGPYFVAGRALARLGEQEQAALAFMRVPIQYPRHRVLAAASLLAAADQLENLDRAEEAVAIYRELVSGHPGTLFTTQAQQRLEQLSAERGR